MTDIRFIRHIPKAEVFKLSAPEKKVIKRVARVQVDSCQKVINNDTDQDWHLEIIKNQIDPIAFKQELQKSITLYEGLLKRPHGVFEFPKEEFSYVKHILFCFANHKKYKVGRKSFWKKLDAMEMVPINYN